MGTREEQEKEQSQKAEAEDAWLPDTNRRDPHKPGESPPLQMQIRGGGGAFDCAQDKQARAYTEAFWAAENLSLRGNVMALFGDGRRRELEKKAKEEGRLPPGQSLTLKWPVLHNGSVPVFDAAKWDFKISGLVEEPVRLTWEEFRALPHTEVTSDFHCVTRWSRMDNRWKGVLFTDVMKLVKPKPGAEFALLLAEEGYTANVPLADLLRPDVLFTFEHDGEPLAAEHGGPLRLIVPHLYAWKSVKWVRGFMLLDHDRLGFWERNGYHAYGDPWKEQRYSGR